MSGEKTLTRYLIRKLLMPDTTKFKQYLVRFGTCIENLECHGSEQFNTQEISN